MPRTTDRPRSTVPTAGPPKRVLPKSPAGRRMIWNPPPPPTSVPKRPRS